MSPSFVCMMMPSSVNGHAAQAQASSTPRRRPGAPGARRRPSSTRPTTVTRSNAIVAAWAAGSESQVPCHGKMSSKGAYARYVIGPYVSLCAAAA